VFGNICAYAAKLVSIAEKSRNKMIVSPTTGQENDMDRYDLILIDMLVIITQPNDKNKMNADRSRKLRYVMV
jgi:argininosuccinate synthase